MITMYQENCSIKCWWLLHCHWLTIRDSVEHNNRPKLIVVIVGGFYLSWLQSTPTTQHRPTVTVSEDDRSRAV